LQTDKNCNFLTLNFYIVKLTKISNASCLDRTTILVVVDTILYLSLYYLVNNLVHLPNPHITCRTLLANWAISIKYRVSNFFLME